MAYKKELDYMNAAGCLLVILIHVLSVGITSVDRSSWLAVLLYVPWRLSAFAVPMFLYTGAVKAARQFGDAALTPRVYFRYILRRFTKIYLPYAAWVAIYYLYFLHIHYVQGGIGEFLSYLLLGNLSSPFYYIVIVMQFYAALPLWVWMLRHVHACTAIGVSLLITLYMGQLPAVLSHFGIEFLYCDRIFPTYLVFWAVGLYAGKQYGRFSAILRERSTLVSGALVVGISCGLSCWQYAAGVFLLNLDQMKIFADLFSVFLLQAAAQRLTECRGFLPKLLSHVHQASFTVYLSHCLFLTYVTIALQDAGIRRLAVLLPVRFLTCYTVPFLVHDVLRRVSARWKKQAHGSS